MIVKSTPEIATYNKVQALAHSVLMLFLSQHVELLFLRYDPLLIEQLFRTLLHGFQAQNSYEILLDSANATNILLDFMFDKQNRKPTHKSIQVHQNVQAFTQKSQQIFNELLSTIVHCVCFEDIKHIWIYNKVLHASLCFNQANDNMMLLLQGVVSRGERDPEVRQKINKELG
jgi:hypothetical protein